MTEPRSAMERALDLAREAAAAGDEPFGAVLVYDDTIIAAERNTANTDGDPTAHPELKLARTAGRQLSPEERQSATMYASTEPCPMCSGAVRTVGLGRVVYSASADILAAITGTDPGPRASEIATATVVDGPLLPEAGREIHEEFW